MFDLIAHKFCKLNWRDLSIQCILLLSDSAACMSYMKSWNNSYTQMFIWSLIPFVISLLITLMYRKNQAFMMM